MTRRETCSFLFVDIQPNLMLIIHYTQLIRKTKIASLKRKECALKCDRMPDISNKVLQSTRQEKDDNHFDMILDTNVKRSKGNSVRGKIRARKAQEDLDLITSYF